MNIGIVCYPTFGGSGVVATELGKALAAEGHFVHFISYSQPARLDFFNPHVFFHEVSIYKYPLFEYLPYETILASKIVDIVKQHKLDILHVHYAIPHASAALMAKNILTEQMIILTTDMICFILQRRVVKWPQKLFLKRYLNSPVSSRKTPPGFPADCFAEGMLLSSDAKCSLRVRFSKAICSSSNAFGSSNGTGVYLSYKL